MNDILLFSNSVLSDRIPCSMMSSFPFYPNSTITCSYGVDLYMYIPEENFEIVEYEATNPFPLPELSLLNLIRKQLSGE